MRLSQLRNHPSMAGLSRMAATMVVQGVDVAAQLIAGVLVGRFLGPEALGVYALAFGAAAIASVLVLLGTGEIAQRMYADRTIEPEEVLSSSVVVWGMGTSLAGVVIVGIGVFLHADARLTWALLLAWATLAGNGLSSVLNGVIVSRGLSQRDLPGVVTSRVLLVGLVAAAAIGRGSLHASLVSFLVSSVILVVSRAFTVHRFAFRLRWAPRRGTVRSLLRSGRHIGVGAVFGSILARADLLLLERLASVQAVGLYGAAYRILNGIGAGVTAMAVAAFPLLLEGRKSDTERAERRFLTIPAVIGLGVVGLTILGGSSLVHWAFGPAFGDARPVLTVLLIAGVFQAQSAFLSKVLIARGCERILPRVQGVAALLNVGLNLWLIPGYGPLGAALSTLGAESLLFATLGWFVFGRTLRAPEVVDARVGV